MVVVGLGLLDLKLVQRSEGMSYDTTTTQRDHFYAEGVMIPSGVAHVVETDGTELVVVCGDEGCDQVRSVNIRDLGAGAKIVVPNVGALVLETGSERGVGGRSTLVATLAGADEAKRAAIVEHLDAVLAVDCDERRYVEAVVRVLEALGDQSVGWGERFSGGADLAEVGSILWGIGQSIGVRLDELSERVCDDDDVAWSTNDWCISHTGVFSTADAVVRRVGRDGTPEVLLIKRSHPPFADGWALPGGMCDESESYVEAAIRELGEETGIGTDAIAGVSELGMLASTVWDPRFVGVTVGAVLVDVVSAALAEAGDDAKSVEWVGVDAIATGRYPLAFGHAEWLRRAFGGELDEVTAKRLEVLAGAGEVRNRRLITKVNAVRKERGAELIEL
jgi:8-oxo-dGTP diphosphatase